MSLLGPSTPPILDFWRPVGSLPNPYLLRLRTQTSIVCTVPHQVKVREARAHPPGADAVGSPPANPASEAA